MNLRQPGVRFGCDTKLMPDINISKIANYQRNKNARRGEHESRRAYQSDLAG